MTARSHTRTHRREKAHRARRRRSTGLPPTGQQRPVSLIKSSTKRALTPGVRPFFEGVFPELEGDRG